MVFLFFQSQENRAFKKYITAYCSKSGNCAHSKSKSSLLVRYHQLLAPFSSFSLSVIRWYIYEKPPGWHYLFRPVSRAGRKWGIWEEIWEVIIQNEVSLEGSPTINVTLTATIAGKYNWLLHLKPWKCRWEASYYIFHSSCSLSWKRDQDSLLSRPTCTDKLD